MYVIQLERASIQVLISNKFAVLDNNIISLSKVDISMIE